MHLHAAHFHLLGHHAAHHRADGDARAVHFQRRRHILDFDLDLVILHLAAAQAFKHFVVLAADALLLLLRDGGRFGLVAQQQVDGIRLFLRRVDDQRGQPVFDDYGSTRLDALGVLRLDHADGRFDQIADDRFHVAADITDFGEFRRFNLDERRVDQLRQAAGDFRLTHARGAGHEDILRRDFLAHRFGQLRAAIAAAQGDGHGALRLVLTDDEAIQLFYNLFWRQLHVIRPPP